MHILGEMCTIVLRRGYMLLDCVVPTFTISAAQQSMVQSFNLKLKKLERAQNSDYENLERDMTCGKALS